MSEPKHPNTLNISKLYLEPWGGWYFKKYLKDIKNTDIEIYVSIDNGIVDKILKIDLINVTKDNLNQNVINDRAKLGIITGNVKTHKSKNSNSYAIHELELHNNDVLIFYEKPFDEDQIIKEKFTENQNNLINDLVGSDVYIISTNIIREHMKNPTTDITNKGDFLTIQLDYIKSNAYTYKFGEY